MSQQLPKILSISLSAWRNDSNAHTQTDLFRFWNPKRVAQIYTKSVLPDTPVCNHFFQISENAVIKSVLNRKAVGRRVDNGGYTDPDTQKAIDQDQRIYAFGRRKRPQLLILARELIWLFGNWRTSALGRFIEEEAPDVYFVPIYPVIYMGMLQTYILKKYPRPYICYLMDDNYSYENCHSVLAYIHRFWLRKYVKSLAENCTEMFTITKTQATETDKLFGTHSIVLTKGINYTGLTYTPIAASGPIRMVYTGNLWIGRDTSLATISKALKKINCNGERMTLDIYSPTVLSEATMKLLNENGCRHHGNISREEVAAVQSAADVVVFAESLERRHRYAARLSFSTKLTDYFKSGKCIFAIGASSIAPIEYLAENDAAIIATTEDEIENKLFWLADHPEMLDVYGKNAFECGRKNHSEDLMRERFVSTFKKAAEEGLRK